MKTLVVIIGSHRGGEETWNSMYKYLLHPLGADLALVNNIFDENSLCKKAKFLWKIDLDQDDLSKSLKNYYEDNFKGQQWYDVFSYHKKSGFGGQIVNEKGSGSLLIALKHHLLKNFLNTILNYDWIILTRSDQYYVNFHENIKELDKRFVYVLPDEKYGGVSDRHFVFHSEIATKVLGMAEFIADVQNKDLLLKEYIYEKYKFLNCERAIKLYFDSMKLKTKGLRRCQFSTSIKGDFSAWVKVFTTLPGHTDLYLKYENEYLNANDNLKLQVQFENLFSKIFIYDTGHKLIRLGAEKDGGYLVPDILDEIKYLFSPGVSNETSFDEDCYKKKITPFLLDGTINYNGPFNFIKKNLNTFSDDNNITIRDWLNLANLAENENNLMLQMDIEGSEWNILTNIELSLLKKFKIIVIEFHFFKRFIKNFKKISNVFKKLNIDFTICHIHPNNYADNFINVKGFEIKRCYEFTFINNNSLLKKTEIKYSLPHELDRPNKRNQKDTVLPDFFYKQTNNPIQDKKALNIINISLKKIIKSKPLIFDVGANVGQSIKRFNKIFNQPFIHSFEPDPFTYEKLVNNSKEYLNLKLNNVAIGEKKEIKIFNLNSKSETNSFHDWHNDPINKGDKTEKKISVPVISLQDYILENNITEIDLIKIDTQGFEEEVLLGLKNKTIVKNFLIEIIFMDYYKKKLSFYSIEKLLGNDFRLYSLQTFNHKEKLFYVDALYTRD